MRAPVCAGREVCNMQQASCLAFSSSSNLPDRRQLLIKLPVKLPIKLPAKLPPICMLEVHFARQMPSAACFYYLVSCQKVWSLVAQPHRLQSQSLHPELVDHMHKPCIPIIWLTLW